MVIGCFLLLYQEPYLSPHHFLLGPARMVLLSVGNQPYLVGQKSFGRLREHWHREGNKAGKVKIKRGFKAVRRVTARLQERPTRAAIQLKCGAEEEGNTGHNSRRLAVRNSLEQKFVSAFGLRWSLLLLCGLP